MTESECLALMKAPASVRPSKPYLGGVIQIWVTRACDKSCYDCTQGSNLAGKPEMITLEQFEQACISLKGYWGVVGMFGGNPCMHPKFVDLCDIMRKHIPANQRGLWSNNPISQEKGMAARKTFNPTYSNLNCHMDREAYNNFKRWWPESQPFGLDKDSRHSPCFVSMKDVGIEENERWKLISTCDINQNWSAMIGVFRDQLRAWFCEIAGAQAMLHQWDRDREVPLEFERMSEPGELIVEMSVYTYPDTGLQVSLSKNPNDVAYNWWKNSMAAFATQVRKHCHECSVPLRGYGELAQSKDSDATEQVSKTHEEIYRPKSTGRKVEVVTELVQLGNRLQKVTDYMGNAKK